MNAMTASDAREKLYQLLDETASAHEPVLITGPHSNAVLTVSALDPRNGRIDSRRSKCRGGGVSEGTRLVTPWRVVFTKQAQKDAKRVTSSGLRPKVELLLNILASDPFQKVPPFEKLIGDLAGAYSRRINIQHRLVYQVLEKERIVKVIRMWTHYE